MNGLEPFTSGEEKRHTNVRQSTIRALIQIQLALDFEISSGSTRHRHTRLEARPN